MIDTHTHARMGWSREEVEHDLAVSESSRVLLAALPLDHWGFAMTDECARLVAAFPDRVAGLIGIHPPDLDASLRAIAEYADRGFVGIKLMPTVGYYPDDERFRPIFEEVNRRGWMVLMHGGWCSKGAPPRDLPQSTRFSDPYHLEPLIRIFPDIDFIIGHAGGRVFFPRAVDLMDYHSNVYIDVCPGQGPWALRHGGPWLDVLKWDRVLFGSDMIFGLPNAAERAVKTRLELRTMLESLGYGDRIDDVLHHNAARLLDRHASRA